VPWGQASKVLDILNKGAYQRRRAKREASPNPEYKTEVFSETMFGKREDCLDPPLSHAHGNPLARRSTPLLTRGIHRIPPRAEHTVPGYVTVDDFSLTGEGDDTAHSAIPSYPLPNDLQANASFPTDGSLPDVVDVVFLDFIGEGYVVPALNSVGGNYTVDDIGYYMPTNFSTNTYLPVYAQQNWQANINDCPVGAGVGFD
ncbi:hypothetical protein BT69DRAFT_972789, partial [Atractiella rhizophila]